MVIPFTLILLLGILTALLHGTGLVLLTRAKDRHVHGNQKYLIVALSLVELGFVASSIIRESIFYATGSRRESVGLYVSLYNTAIMGFMYYFIMFVITLDRFFELRLNIKYQLYWNKNRTKNSLILVSFIVNVSWIALSCISLSHQQPTMVLNIHDKTYKMYYLYFCPVMNTIFVIFAAIVYSYIFFKLHQNRKKEDALRKQLGCNETTTSLNLKVKKYRVPFWIIITFILFCIVPDILQLISFVYLECFHEFIHSASYVLYRLGHIADAVIYIFSLNYVKIKLREFKRNILNQIFQ